MYLQRLKVIGGLLTFLSIHSHAMQTPSTSADEQKLLALQESIANINELIEKDAMTIPSNSSPIMLLGLTGEGKSTLINFLAQKKLTVIDHIDGLVIGVAADDHPLTGSHISHEGSCTDRPSKHIIDGLTLYDCAGLETMLDTYNNIRDSYAIYKLFKTFPTAKILAVISEPSIKGRGKGLVTFVKRIKEFFGQNIDQLAQVSCICITKNDPRRGVRNEERVRAKLNNLVDARELDINEQARNLLRGWGEPTSHIVLVPAPDDEGPFLPDNEGTQLRDALLDKFRTLQAINDVQIIPTLTVSAEAKNVAFTMANSFTAEILQFINTTVEPGIKQYCYNRIATAVPSITLQELRNSFMTLIADLRVLGRDHPLPPDQFSHRIQNVLRRCDLRQHFKKINAATEYITFLKSVNDNIAYPFSDWSRGLVALEPFISTLAQHPVTTFPQPGLLYIHGFLLGTSDVQREIQSLHPNVKKIIVHSLHKLWIDSDIDWANPDLNNAGHYLSFISPTWQVVGDPVIELSGQDGEIRAASRTSRPTGDHGLPGDSGRNGGHFYGKGQSFVGLDHLTIRTNGGVGQNGEPGIAGKDGEAGQDGDLTSVTRTESYDIDASQYGPGWRARGTKSFYEAPPTEIGTDGQDGGRGGKGGMGGRQGSAQIDGVAQPFAWIHETGDGSNGHHGTHAAGGQAATKGRYCRGTVLKGQSAFVAIQEPVVGEYYYIQNQQSGQVLNELHAHTDGAHEMTAHPIDGFTSHKMFKLIDRGNGYYYIQNQQSGQVLNELHAHTSGEHPMSAHPINEYISHQSFKLIGGGGEYYYIQNKQSGQMLNEDHAQTSGPHKMAARCLSGHTSHKLFRFLPGAELKAKRAVVHPHHVVETAVTHYHLGNPTTNPGSKPSGDQELNSTNQGVPVSPLPNADIIVENTEAMRRYTALFNSQASNPFRGKF
ncbi:MAG: RICIN domain-containing protein [Candidatus Paracaedibacteraceae bacterium]|nr:RICIN domain-containing protein [Candidatus Paracaedibacteraceae bacterium]